MECRGDADPSPVYTWYKDGDLLTPERMGDLGVNLISNEEHSQLEFPSPTNIQEGFYHCEARNDLGKNNHYKMFFVFHSLFLVFPILLMILASHISSSGLALSSVTHVSSVAAPPPPGTSAPRWLSPPKTEIKSLGSRVELECRAGGSPEPGRVWTKNGEVITGEISLGVSS